MKYQRILWSFFLILIMSLPSLAQSRRETMYRVISQLGTTVQNNMQQTQQLIQMAQSVGASSYEFEKLQMDMNLHQNMMAYLEYAYQNPDQTLSPAGTAQFVATAQEYKYRYETGDYRPSEQIQGQLQQHAAHDTWQHTTAAGQASLQAERQQAQQSFDNYQAQARRDSAQRDKYHRQFVNTIHDRYQYVNPYDGQNYMAPNIYQANPVMQNPDGSYTELVPYQSW